MSETYGRTDMHSCGCTEDADGYVTVFCAAHRDLELPDEVAAARIASDDEAWGGRGPSASYAEWEAEGREGSG